MPFQKVLTGHSTYFELKGKLTDSLKLNTGFNTKTAGDILV